MRYLRDWESDTWLVQARVDLRGRGGMGDNIMIEIYNSFERYLIIFTFWHCLRFLVKQLLIRLQFTNCNISGTCHIDSATARNQPPPLKNPLNIIPL